MSLRGVNAVMTVESATGGQVFKAYVEQVLCSKLGPGDVVILDNLSPHKAPGRCEPILARGAQLLDLPPYSPDLNPIENALSKFKKSLRGAKARTKEALDQAVTDALKTMTAGNAAASFRHCGYQGTATVSSLWKKQRDCDHRPWTTAVIENNCHIRKLPSLDRFIATRTPHRRGDQACIHLGQSNACAAIHRRQ